MSIRTKLTLIAIFGIIALTSVINIFSYRSCKSSLKDQRMEQMSSIAMSNAKHVSIYLEEEMEEVEMISTLDPVRRSLLASTANESEREQILAAANVVLREWVDPDKHLRRIKVMDRQGIVVLSSSDDCVGMDESSAPYFTEGLKGEYMGDAVRSMDGIPEFNLSSPIVDNQTDEVLGVVNLRFRMTIINDILSDRTGMGETGEVYLVNRIQTFISPSRFVDDAFLKIKAENAEETCIGENSREGAHEHDGGEVGAGLYTGYRGVPVLGASACVAGTTWCAIAEMEAEEAFAPAQVLGRTLLLLTIVFTAGGIAVASVITRFIADPILSLREGTRKLASGDWDVKLNIRSGDEIEDLANSFSAMAAKIKEATHTLEMRVQERTEELETMIESAPIGIFLVDAETHIITRANKTASSMLRMEPDEICGKGCQHLICTVKDGGCPVVDNGEEVTRAECRLRLPDGKELTVMKSVNLVTIDGKEFLLETFVDITEMKNAEIALTHSEERMRAILDNSTAFVTLKNPDGSYIFVNRKFEELFGLKNHQIIGKTGHDVLPAEIADILAESDEEVKETRKPLEREEVIPLDGREWVYLSVKFPLLNRLGEPYAVCTICTDITERIEAEEELNVKIKELEEFNQLAVGRELRMVELKAEINDHLQGVGEDEKYEIVR